ncbi:hypothetical protein TNCV_301531 [Trichonephila clavipes]|nr:hypothetical protein TNCV_301531 [Trichonephila clavipes]
MGCGSPVVKVSDNGRQVMSSSPVPLKPRRLGSNAPVHICESVASAEFWARFFFTMARIDSMVSIFGDIYTAKLFSGIVKIVSEVNRESLVPGDTSNSNPGELYR